MFQPGKLIHVKEHEHTIYTMIEKFSEHPAAYIYWIIHLGNLDSLLIIGLQNHTKIAFIMLNLFPALQTDFHKILCTYTYVFIIFTDGGLKQIKR